jgi:hypothetical protein
MGIMHAQKSLLDNGPVDMQISAKQIVMTVTAFRYFPPFVRLSEIGLRIDFCINYP